MLEKLRFLGAMVATPRALAATLALLGSNGCLVVAPCAGGGQCISDEPDLNADGGSTEESGVSTSGETSEGASDSTQVTDSTTETVSTESTSTDSASTEPATTDTTSVGATSDEGVGDGGTGETSELTGNSEPATSSDVASDTAATTDVTVDVTDEATSDTVSNGETNGTASEPSSEPGSSTTTAPSSSDSDTSAPVVPTTSDVVDSTSDVADTSSEPGTTTDEDTEPQGVPVHEVKWQEGFEDGLAGWTAEGATWTADPKTNGAAPTAQSGSRSVGTGMAGPYVREDSRLLSPQFIVPPRYREPYLRYWYWYQLEPGDTVQVQVRIGDSPTWVDFQTLTDTLSTVAGDSGKWLQGILPLSDFGGEEIQLSFALDAIGENCSFPGFFVDNVSLETGPMNVCSCQGFNDGGFGDWSVEGGQWAIGAPVNSGAPVPSDGNGAAGTNLYGDYVSLAAAPRARLASPTIKVAGDGSTKATLKYWYSFAITGEGQIQLRVVGEQWVDLPHTFSGTQETWTNLEIPLNQWAGKVVQIGFLMKNGGGVETPTTRGFYIDEFKF